MLIILAFDIYPNREILIVHVRNNKSVNKYKFI